MDEVIEAVSMIRWPDRFSPARAPVHVRNEIDIEGPADRVWAWLIRAPRWPAWYPNASGVAIEGSAGNLSAGVGFRWRTFSASLRSLVEEFDPPSRLAWSARGLGVDVYHAWLITPTPSGCHVLTEESQYGSLARLDHALRPHRMERGHQLWLENLRVVVGSGRAPE